MKVIQLFVKNSLYGFVDWIIYPDDRRRKSNYHLLWLNVSWYYLFVVPWDGLVQLWGEFQNFSLAMTYLESLEWKEILLYIGIHAGLPRLYGFCVPREPYYWKNRINCGLILVQKTWNVQNCNQILRGFYAMKIFLISLNQEHLKQTRI